MKVDLEKKSGCRRILKIEIPDAELKSEMEAVYRDIGRTAKIPGFRAGKIPRQILEQRFAKEAQDQLLKRVIPQAYSKAVQEKELHPVGNPHVKDVKFKENEPLKFEALLDVSPVIKLSTYQGIKLKKKKVEVKEEEVVRALENLRQQQAQYKVVSERGVEAGDMVIADWDLVCEGNPVEKVKDTWLLIEEKNFIPGFCPLLIGAKAGEKKEIRIQVPADYRQKQAAGKEGIFQVAVKEIKERIVPELNDDFAKELGKFETLTQVREELKKQLERIKEKDEENNLKHQVEKQLISENNFDLPEFLVERVAEEVLRRAAQQMLQRGVSEKELEAQFETLKKNAREKAEAEVRLSYIVDEIGKAESVAVAKEDIEKYLAQQVQAGQNPAYLKQIFEHREQLEELKSHLLTEKVLQFLVSQGKITVED